MDIGSQDKVDAYMEGFVDGVKHANKEARQVIIALHDELNWTAAIPHELAVSLAVVRSREPPEIH